METIYNLIASRLKNEITELQWIDLDAGQLDHDEYRAAIDFPAVLIDIAFSGCENMGHSGDQTCDTVFSLRIVSQCFSETNIHAPEDIRENGLKHFRLLNEIQKALQGWSEGDEMGTLYRQSSTPEKRNDGLKVHTVRYNTEFYDANNAIEMLEKATPELQIQ